LLKSSALADKYESIGLILGDERRRYISATQAEIANESRSDFIAAQKSSRRSLLVNVDVLTEGYDDPTVNTIVMARPTNSKLVYMQALGRAVRIDPENETKEAYVVEVVDNLPNIKCESTTGLTPTYQIN
jgi:superfamily II DNA or RNA helicase